MIRGGLVSHQIQKVETEGSEMFYEIALGLHVPLQFILIKVKWQINTY